MEYERNNKGIAQLLEGSELLNFVRQRASHAAHEVAATAPVRTGRYRNSITSYTDHDPPRRPAGVVTATVPYAAKVEHKYHTISRAADIAERG